MDTATNYGRVSNRKIPQTTLYFLILVRRTRGPNVRTLKLVFYGGGLFWAYWYRRGFPSRVSMPSFTRSMRAWATAVLS